MFNVLSRPTIKLAASVSLPSSLYPNSWVHRTFLVPGLIRSIARFRSPGFISMPVASGSLAPTSLPRNCYVVLGIENARAVLYCLKNVNQKIGRFRAKRELSMESSSKPGPRSGRTAAGFDRKLLWKRSSVFYTFNSYSSLTSSPVRYEICLKTFFVVGVPYEGAQGKPVRPYMAIPGP
jgi:hypothetical protein